MTTTDDTDRTTDSIASNRPPTEAERDAPLVPDLREMGTAASPTTTDLYMELRDLQTRLDRIERRLPTDRTRPREQSSAGGSTPSTDGGTTGATIVDSRFPTGGR